LRRRQWFGADHSTALHQLIAARIVEAAFDLAVRRGTVQALTFDFAVPMLALVLLGTLFALIRTALLDLNVQPRFFTALYVCPKRWRGRCEPPDHQMPAGRAPYPEATHRKAGLNNTHWIGPGELFHLHRRAG